MTANEAWEIAIQLIDDWNCKKRQKTYIRDLRDRCNMKSVSDVMASFGPEDIYKRQNKIEINVGDICMGKLGIKFEVTYINGIYFDGIYLDGKYKGRAIKDKPLAYIWRCDKNESSDMSKLP